MNNLPFANHPREIERQIIVLLVEDLLAAGYRLGVLDGEETVLEPSAANGAAAVFAAMSTTDEDYLLTRKDDLKGWIRLVYGNDGSVISDYTTNIPECVFERANALAARFR
jgi:hypothetical protein